MKNLILLLCLLFSLNVSANFNFAKDRSIQVFKFDELKDKLNHYFFASDDLPETIQTDVKEYKVSYTVNTKLNDFIKKLIKKTRSDYSAVVVIDNNTGDILSLVDYDKLKDSYGREIALNATSPAASLFKVITAADLIENSEVTKDSLFTYNGRASTLYRNQLKPNKNRWTRTISFEKAFAYSNNVIFGKAAIQNLELGSLYNMASKFGFNRSLLEAVDVLPSQLLDAKTDYNLAELASGFNRKTLISPLHATAMASIIANDGIFKKPSIVTEVVDKDTDKVVWRPHIQRERVLSEVSSAALKQMMHSTVLSGTARSAFRPWKTKRISDIYIGGKTGSITGGVPFGKRDWFISYAMPKGATEDKGISVGVMIVNVKKWYVKSTYLAKEIIEYYYDDLKDKRM